MPDLTTSLLGDAFSYLSQRAQQTAAAQAYANSIAIAKTTSSSSSTTSDGYDPNHKISIELLNLPLPPQPNQSPTNTVANNGDYSVIASIDFDVVMNADAFAQTMRQQHVARQEIHQTLSGFYTDQFGIGPGQISIDADIIFYTGDPATQILAFKQALIMAKNQSPLNLKQPPVMYLHDMFTGQSLQITQTTLEIEQSAEMLNWGHITLDAVILMDYSSNLSSQTNAARVTAAGSPTTGIQQSLYGPSGSGFQVPTITANATKSTNN